jgi:hypothetical protein
VDIKVDDRGVGIMEGVNVFDAKDKLRENEFLRQKISIRDVIQIIHTPVRFNAFLLEGRKEKRDLVYSSKEIPIDCTWR